MILGRGAALCGIPATDLPSDVIVLSRALQYQQDLSYMTTIDISDCGTAMRFLTAYFAALPSNVLLTGTQRIKQRPIAPLVDALRSLGADIQYKEKEGFPPLLIKGKRLNGGAVQIKGDVSSQFVSALMLISDLTDRGIDIDILPPVASSPYIRLTQEIINDKNFSIEPDWSAAAFWYEYVAIGGQQPIILRNLRLDSVQGDSIAKQVFEQLGVETEECIDGLKLKRSNHICSYLEWDFIDCPDLYPSVAATCYALNVKTRFSGTETLKYKESDRLAVMQHVLSNLNEPIDSDDHRIVMALAMLKLKNPKIAISNTQCVAKSYPGFWEQYDRL